MLTILLSRDWVAGREEILKRIASDVAKKQGGRILLVPELISHDMERRLCAAAGDTASRFAEVLSFSRLASRVADVSGNAAAACLDGGGRIVAMAAATRQVHSQLKAYAAVENKPEFLKELVDAVDEFKRCCISSQMLADAAAQTEGTLAQKLQELSLILESYDALCSRGLRDPRDRLTWCLEQLEECDFASQRVFYIDGFPDFTRQNMAILEHLIQNSALVTVSLNCDRPDSDAMAFEKAGETCAQIIQIAKRACVPYEIVTVEAEHALLPFCEHIFQGNLTQMLRFDSRVQAVRTDSVQSEVMAAADHVIELVRSGCRYRDVGVVCADMNTYLPTVQLVFNRCGIPIYQAGTEDVLQKSVITMVLAAMDAACGGFEQRDVLRYLKSILAPIDTDTCDLLENYVITWGIRGNAFFKEWVNHPDGIAGEWTDEAKQQLIILNSARLRALTPLEGLSKAFRSARNLSEQVEGLYAFLMEIGLAERLQQLAEQMNEAEDFREAQILNQLWEILLSALEQMHDTLGQTVWEPDIFTRLFTLLLSQYDVGTIPPVLDAVMVGSVSVMRCQQEKHLIVLGAAEGALPGYGGSAGLLTDQERVMLRNIGVPLTGGALEGIQAEFAEIYGVFCGARESVYVSCPAGEESYLLRRIAYMAGGECNVADPVGSAGCDSWETGAFLARFGAEDAACRLDVNAWYQDALRRAGFDMGHVSTTHISSLYGKKLRLSASQVDRHAECRMSYFLKYGLRAKERKETTIDPAEFGTYVHEVLELTAHDVMEKGGFETVSLEEVIEIAAGYSEKYAAEHFAQLESQRIDYLFRRNWREVEMVIRELWDELKESAFRPEYFELEFSDEGKMPPIGIDGGGMSAILRGFVDRVDIWKKGNQHYFRVVDYKTGRKDFDYCDVFNGVGLQMLLYLFALEQEGAEVIGGHPVAAGVQYFPARAPLVSADGRLTDEEAAKARRSEWKRRGLLLSDEDVLRAMQPDDDMYRLCCTRKKDGTISGDLADREQLKLLRGYVFMILSRMVGQIAAGDITANPYTRGTSHDACTYCPYGSICHKNELQTRRNYKAMTSQQFWDAIGKEMDHHG